MARLTNEQWAQVRTTWESDAREGFQWLLEEMRLNVSRPAVSQRASNEGWTKIRPAVGSMSNTAKQAEQQLTPAPKKLTQAPLKLTPELTLKPEKLTQKTYAGEADRRTSESDNLTGNVVPGALERRVGRPEKYHSSYASIAQKMCLVFGATDAQLAACFDVCEQTINTWKLTHPEFLESIQQGKLIADANVAQALYERATGYSHPDVHITAWQGEAIITPTTKHYPPDVSAAKYWLNNRQPAHWRHQVEVEVNATISRAKIEELDAIYEAGLQKMRQAQADMQARRRELPPWPARPLALDVPEPE